MMALLRSLAISFVLILPAAAAYAQVPYPCSVVLDPVRDIPNARGTALIAKVKKPYTEAPGSPVRERQSVGIYADWLPDPASFGDYDQFEGIARIPDQISWRFTMHQVQEDAPSWFGGSPWGGKFDEISSELTVNTQVEVRPFNSKTKKAGEAVLRGNLQGCRS
ncbi:hypothetical protein Q3B96_20800 [Bacillus licheniformis]|uniref:hypothetical protein n=1 Tax=Bacillus licheniformis TaxID=1402 RepID=UPI00267481C8|nr:hypothetical protein [Bacillus licheniformis]WKU32565.1 hypothetical protein Q3B96_20800 [Bacillus licheniformis]